MAARPTPLRKLNIFKVARIRSGRFYAGLFYLEALFLA
jgi:hypothetical protein